MISVLILVLGVALSLDTLARDPGQRSAFVKHHPCPSTGKARGACPGYVVDHIKPLCAGGADSPSNMAWQTKGEAKLKDRAERSQCRRQLDNVDR